MDDVYIVVLRIRGWEFMAETHTFFAYAKKALRDLAADQLNFYDEGQNSSNLISMQNGAAAAGSAKENALLKHSTEFDESTEFQEPVAFELPSDTRLAGKRKAADNLLEVAERKLELTERLMTCMERFDPEWRHDTMLQSKAKQWLLNTFSL
jgi:hypothetical protein